MPPKFDYQEIETGYYDRIFQKKSGPQSKWHWQKFEVFRDMIHQAGFSPGAKLLDIACGPGTFIGTLDASIEAVGVDIAAPQISYATEQYGAPGKQFVKIDPGPLPFEDNHFDIATCIELIEHLTPEQVTQVLSEARRVLKPGGLLLVSTPNYHSGWPLLEVIVNRLSELSYADQHINKFYSSRLRQLLRELGFRQETVRPYQGLAPFGAFLSWQFADTMLRIEKTGLANMYGFLLLGSARK